MTTTECKITYLDTPPRFEFSEKICCPVDATGFRPLPMEFLKPGDTVRGKVKFVKEINLLNGTLFPCVKTIEWKERTFTSVR